jgi:hypothetical protein
MLIKEKIAQFWTLIDAGNARELESLLKEIERTDPSDFDPSLVIKEDLRPLLATQNRGNTALHELCERADFDKIKVLLSFAPDLTMLNAAGKTAEALLPETREGQKVRFLLEFHAQQAGIASDRRTDVERTLFLVEQALEKMTTFEAVEGETILVFGNTRDGKSTLINYFLGVNYEIGVIPGSDSKMAIPKGTELATVGRTQLSETSYPSVYSVTGSAKFLIDMPGYHDNRSGGKAAHLNPYDITAGVCTKVLSKKIKQVKTVVLVMPWAKLLSHDINDILKPLGQFMEMLPASPAEMEKVLNNVVLAITKVDPTELERIKRALVQAAGSACRVEPKMKAIFKHLIDNAATHVRVMDITNDTSRDLFYRHVDGLRALPASCFNFGDGNAELGEFLRLTQDLRRLHVAVREDLNAAVEAVGIVEGRKKALNADLLSALEALPELPSLEDMTVYSEKLGGALRELDNLVGSRQAAAVALDTQRLRVEVSGKWGERFDALNALARSSTTPLGAHIFAPVAGAGVAVGSSDSTAGEELKMNPDGDISTLDFPQPLR